ncbi:MAG: hypothetical protein WCB94_18270, partial [Terriglobales bacterium]
SKAKDANATKHADDFSEQEPADWARYTLGDRIGEPMRSRVQQMCRIVEIKSGDFRKNFRSASFG